MMFEEAAALLALISRHDGRRASEGQAELWAQTCTDADITLEEAMVAANRWCLANPDGWMRPGHLMPAVADLRRERRIRRREEQARLLAIEPGKSNHLFEPGNGGRCAVPGCGETDEGGRRHIRDRSAKVTALVEALRDRLPEGDKAMRDSLAGKPRPNMSDRY
jgi:hypothetical protein